MCLFHSAMPSEDQPRLLYKTFSFRVKDATSRKYLVRLGNAVNTVWNYCNEISQKSAQRGPKWATKKQLRDLTKGAGRELDLPSQVLPSQVVQEVIDEFIIKRRAAAPPTVALAQELWVEPLARPAPLHQPGHCGRRIDRAAARAEIPPLEEARHRGPDQVRHLLSGCPRPLGLQFGVRDRAAGAGQPQQGGWLARSSRTPRPRRSRKSVRNVAPST